MEEDDFSWWKERIASAAIYFHGCKLDSSINHPGFLKEVIGKSPILTFFHENMPTPYELNGNGCPIKTYPQSEHYPKHSSTELSIPTTKLNHEQQFKLIQDAHATQSLFHITSLRSYISLIPELNWTGLASEKETEWKQFFKPSVEDLINHQPLREAMQACIE